MYCVSLRLVIMFFTMNHIVKVEWFCFIHFFSYIVGFSVFKSKYKGNNKAHEYGLIEMV